MVYINNNPTSGNIIGKQLGEGLMYLAQNKLAQLQQQGQQQEQASKIAKALQALPGLGLNEQQAQQAAYLPESILKEFTRQQLLAPTRENYGKALQSILNESQPNSLERLQPPSTGLSTSGSLNESQLNVAPQGRSPINLPKGLTENQLGKAADLILKQKEREQSRQQFLATYNLRKEIAEKNAELKKLSHEQRQLEHKTKQESAKQVQIDKNTEPEVKRINTAGRTGKETTENLRKMVDLIHKGNLPGPKEASFYQFLEKFGINSDAFLSGDAVEYRKLAQSFLKGIKDVFRGTITNQDVKEYLKLVPTLALTDEGKLAVINNLAELAEGAEIEQNLMDEIIAENGGERPRDLTAQIRKRSAPLLKKIAEDFKDINKKRFPGKPLATKEQVIERYYAKEPPPEEPQTENFLSRLLF